MDLVHQLVALTGGPTSGCSLIVMVQPTQDRKSDHLVPCILRGRNQSALLGDLLSNPLMGSSLVEVSDIGIEHTLELPLMQDQQVVQAFLSDAPHIAFADRIGSGSVIGGLEQLDATCFRHTSKARPKLAIVITDQILWPLSIRGLLGVVGPPRDRTESVSRPHGSPSLTSIR